MDVFEEQIVRQRRTPAVKMIQILIILLAAFLCVFTFFYMAVTEFAYLIIITCALIWFGAWKLIGRFYIEYEYAFTNGELDIDRITNKKKRLRLLGIDCKSIESYGRFKPQEHSGKAYNERIFAANPDSPNLFCIVCQQEKKGSALIVFEPNEAMREAMLKFIPRRAVISDDSSRH